MKKLWFHGLGWIFHRPALFAMNYSRVFGKILVLFEVKSIIPVRLQKHKPNAGSALPADPFSIDDKLTSRCRPSRANLFHFAEFNIASGEIALQKSGNGAIKERLVHHLVSKAEEASGENLFCERRERREKLLNASEKLFVREDFRIWPLNSSLCSLNVHFGVPRHGMATQP